jgi:hypothetical protein
MYVEYVRMYPTLEDRHWRLAAFLGYVHCHKEQLRGWRFGHNRKVEGEAAK